MDKNLTFFCLSDLHGTVYEPDNRQIRKTAADCKPDLILASGDMMSGDKEEADGEMIRLLTALTQTAPVFFVDGNHEMQARELHDKRYAHFVRALQNGGVCVLNNASVHRTIAGKQIGIYGYELPWEYYRRFNRKRPEVSELRKAIGSPVETEFTILLTHNPVYFPEYAKWGADFVFAGHLHGGFIRLPFAGGIVSPQFEIFPKYDKGVFEIGKSRMAVGAGMGNHSWLFRINNPAEMVVVKTEQGGQRIAAKERQSFGKGGSHGNSGQTGCI